MSTVDGLIDPSRFAVSSAEIDAESVERAALDMARMGTTVRSDVTDISALWRGLAVAYHAPEQARVDALVHPAVVTADDVDSRLARGSRALQQFADELRNIKPRLAAIESRAHGLRSRALRAGMLDGGASSWRDDVELVRANDDLVHDVSRLMAELARSAEDCEHDLRSLAAAHAGALSGSIGGPGAGGRSVPMAPPEDPIDSPGLTGPRGSEERLPRVIIHEENPAHLELDLIGLLPVVGEPADLLNALIYAWERDWGNAAISVAGAAPVVGSAGTLARIAARTNGVPGPTPRLSQAKLEHIVRRHWWTSGSGAGVGRFANGLSLSMLTNMIDAALRHGRIRPNTRRRPGTIYEIDLVRIIGVNGAGQQTSRLRVIVDEFGEIMSAFPF